MVTKRVDGVPVAARLRTVWSRRSAVAVLIVVPLVAATVVPATAAPVEPGPDIPTLQPDYESREFAAAARELPRGLATAIERDLGITPAQYLASSQAAVDAASIVEQAIALGVEPEHVELDGTVVTVTVESADEQQFWLDRGFETRVGEAPEPRATPDRPFMPTLDLQGGDMITFGNTTRRCSIAASGTSAAGLQQLLTAGHCGFGFAAGDAYNHRSVTVPGRFPSVGGASYVGVKVPGAVRLGGGYDAALISIDGNTVRPTAAVSTYGDGQAAANAEPPLLIRNVGAADAFPAETPVCASGATTGWTCGVLVEDSPVTDQKVGAPTCTPTTADCYLEDGFVTTACVLGGDSGGTFVTGTTLLGVASASTFFYDDPEDLNGQPIAPFKTAPETCLEQAGQGVSLAFALRYSSGSAQAGWASVANAFPGGWEATVHVDQPVISTPVAAAPYNPDATLPLSGTILEPNSGHSVSVRVGTTGLTTVDVDDTTGQWSLDIPAASLPADGADVWVLGRWGERSAAYVARLSATPGEGWSAAETYEARFRDVVLPNQFFIDIAWLAGVGVSTGYADNTFRPVAPVGRDAMAAFLYRFAGSPAFTPPLVSPFSDVATSNQFYKEITWLRSTGITTGYPDGTYRPLGTVNRDAMAAFLYRFAEEFDGLSGYVPPSSSAFIDVTTANQFYREVSWLASTGISTGYGDGTFRPLYAVNRDAMAAFLNRYDTSVTVD